MDDQQQKHTAGPANGVPTLLTIRHAFQSAGMKRVVEEEGCGFEADTVFFLV
jgi:hypothetical protein